MKVFEIIVNGDKPKLVGLSSSGVISCILTIVRKKNKKTVGRESISIGVSGLFNEPTDEKTYVRWLDKKMKVGDLITIRVKTGRKSDAPISSRTEPIKNK
jgi:hypothetical protein